MHGSTLPTLVGTIHDHKPYRMAYMPWGTELRSPMDPQKNTCASIPTSAMNPSPGLRSTFLFRTIPIHTTSRATHHSRFCLVELMITKLNGQQSKKKPLPVLQPWNAGTGWVLSWMVLMFAPTTIMQFLHLTKFTFSLIYL